MKAEKQQAFQSHPITRRSHHSSPRNKLKFSIWVGPIHSGGSEGETLNSIGLTLINGLETTVKAVFLLGCDVVRLYFITLQNYMILSNTHNILKFQTRYHHVPPLTNF